MMLTLTWPSDGRGNRLGTIRDAWLGASRALVRFCDALRHKVLRETGRKLEYAWVLEAHASGWPHAHLVVNEPYVDYRWCAEAWAAARRGQVAMIFGKAVYSRDGVCHYLVKYLTKARITPCLVAMLAGKRLFASTMPAREPDGPLWRIARRYTWMQARCIARNVDAVAAMNGWHVAWESEGQGWELWRPVDVGEPIADAERREIVRVAAGQARAGPAPP